MRIKIFTTGGTIDKVYFDAKSEYAVGQPQISEILAQALVTVEYEIEQLFQKDSLDITEADRSLIVRRVREDPAGHILITHGTDTMVETARALDAINEKVIVLVGSLSPARFKGSDAEFNIGFALGALQACSAGVYVAMNGRVFTSDNVRKNREANRFEAIGSGA
jgi:L-asparaginase